MTTPHLSMESDDEGYERPETLSTIWDIAFGCTMSFGPDPDDALRAVVHVSDKARRDGVARLETTPAALRALASQLLQVADAYDQHHPPSVVTECPLCADPNRCCTYHLNTEGSHVNPHRGCMLR